MTRKRLHAHRRLTGNLLLVLAALWSASFQAANAAGIGLTYWIVDRSMSQSTCLQRAANAISNSGLIATHRESWYVFGAGDGKTAYVSCLANDRGGVTANVTAATTAAGGDTFAFAKQIIALLENPNAAVLPPPGGTGGSPSLTWWVESRAMSVAQCQANGARVLAGAGYRSVGQDNVWAGGENDRFDSYVYCKANGNNVVVNITVAADPGVDVIDEVNALRRFFDDPSSKPAARTSRNLDPKIGNLGAPSKPQASSTGKSTGKSTAKASPATPPPATGFDPAVLTKRRRAESDCKQRQGNLDRDVRFTLAAASFVRIAISVPAAQNTWWITTEDHSGPIVANVVNGQPLQMPAGSSPGEGLVSLPAGTFVFHVDCASSQTPKVSAELLLPEIPAVEGPTYLVSAKKDSDRIFVLTEAQTVRVVDLPPTGSIISFSGSILWSRDRGRLELWSTLDLMPRGYCLHGDWPDQTPRIFGVEFVGPAQPGGTKTLTAHASLGPDGVQQSRGVQFTLSQAQVVNVRGARNAWIIDEAGNLWYNVVEGRVQSGSSWVQSTGRIMSSMNRPAADRADLPGALLPPGTYHFAVSAPSGTVSGEIEFVGKKEESFDWPATQTHPCFPYLADTVKLPSATPPLSGGIPAAMRATWKGHRPRIDSTAPGEQGAIYDTHIGQVTTSAGSETLFVQVVTSADDLAYAEQLMRERVGVPPWNYTAQRLEGTSSTLYLESVGASVEVSQLDDGKGPVFAQQKFEFFCGSIEVDGTVAIPTGYRWRRTDSGPQYDTNAVEAKIRANRETLRQRAYALAKTFIDNLIARNLCSTRN